MCVCVYVLEAILKVITEIRCGGPCLSLMLHFHIKWSISSKGVSGGFRNMIIHAAKWMSLLWDDTRQFRAAQLL